MRLTLLRANANDVTVDEGCPMDRAPIGKPKVAKTSELGRFLCAKLLSSPKIVLGKSFNHPATSNWVYGSFQNCPDDHGAPS